MPSAMAPHAGTSALSVKFARRSGCPGQRCSVSIWPPLSTESGRLVGLLPSVLGLEAHPGRGERVS